MSASVADDMIRSLIDRVLRLKEEQDALAADIREVYAEAKGNGYDKTAMGEVVAYLRKIEKKGKDAVSERTAMFDLYLSAYERPSHTHARESQPCAEVKGIEVIPSSGDVFADLGVDRPAHLPPHDAETGEVIDNQEQPGEPATESQGVHEARSMQAESMGDEISAEITPSAAPAVEPEAAPQAPQSASGEVSDADIPAFIKRDYVLRPHCLNPSLCAGSGSKHCHACLKARDESILADEVAA